MQTQFIIRSFIITLFLMFSSAIAAADGPYQQTDFGSIQHLRWVVGGYRSCDLICKDHYNYSALPSGNRMYNNMGYPLYVCAATAGDPWELRSGYNVGPNWNTGCYIAYDGKERMISQFSCLCYKN